MMTSHRLSVRWLTLFGFVCVCIFALTSPINREISRLGEIGLLLVVFFQAKAIFQQEKSEKNLWLYALMVIFILYMQAVNAWAETAYPFEDLNHARFSRHYGKIFLFLAAGWWIAASEKRALMVIGCLFASLLGNIIISGELISMVQQPTLRYSLGFSNAQHSAAYAGSLLIAGLCLVPRAFSCKTAANKTQLLGTLIGIIAVSAIAAYVSQTRGVWLGLALVFPIILLSWANQLPMIKHLQTSIKLLIGLVLGGLIVLYVSQSPPVQKRLHSEHSVSQQLASDSSQELSSMGIRLHQWQLALSLIKARPITGYGGATKEWLIAQSDLPSKAKTGFGHFHNSYLELAVGYGLPAAILFVAVLAYLALRIYRAYRSQLIPQEYMFFGLCWLLYFAVINVFESYVMYRTGYTLLACLGGIFYSFTHSNTPLNNASIYESNRST